MLVAYMAGTAAACLAVAVPLRKHDTLAAWAFFVGMLLLAAESAVSALGQHPWSPDRVGMLQMVWLGVKSVLPGVWLCFSLTYARGDGRETLRRSRLLLAATFLIPPAIILIYGSSLMQLVPSGIGNVLLVRYTPTAKALSMLLLVGSVLILMQLERTFRSAVGTMQWRVKFVVLGLGLVFGSRIYTRSQALLYSADTTTAVTIESGALLLGCAFIGLAYLRGGFGDIDIYPSRAALHTSITVILAGAYLFAVGVLAQFVGRTRMVAAFELQTLLIICGLALFAVLLLSDRLRQSIERFISRHFNRPEHDFRKVWSRFSRATGTLVDRSSLCSAAARITSETFNALSVSIWTWDKRTENLSLGAATTDLSRSLADLPNEQLRSASILDGLSTQTAPFDLDRATGDWVQPLRAISPPQFPHGGDRICVPLAVGEQTIGCMILADRVNGAAYTQEEFDLLKCIGDQLGASLLNLRLTEEVMAAKELEAFQTMSTFFVHDLKNAASTLTLMLQNLPVHFQDPAFREDALRGIRRTTDRINQMISSLSVVREKLALNPVELDLNKLLEDVLEQLNDAKALQVVRDLQPLPKVIADRHQMQSVMTNLLFNARDAVSENGTVRVETDRSNGWATVSVSDDGCGMSETFLRESLFRPFCTTKKKGLGIGMFQSKMIVEAHGGRIQVTSDLGKGTTFTVLLPLKHAGQ